VSSNAQGQAIRLSEAAPAAEWRIRAQGRAPTMNIPAAVARTTLVDVEILRAWPLYPAIDRCLIDGWIDRGPAQP